ncbi:MAG: choice-of-anchor tandem repeat GloVer-containing protein [Bacteroidia bacterium]
MKKNLLICIFIFTVCESASAQNQLLWGLAPTGGQYSSGTLYTINTNGTGFNALHHFQPPDGFTPQGLLLLASDGNFYGTCYDGGSFSSCTIFKYNPVANTYTDVYDFDIVNGDFPRSGLIEAPNGMLYGAAYGGGTGCTGVLYSFDKSNNQYTKIHTFNTGCGPKDAPLLVNGVLYGMTYTGGANNKGVIYSFDISTSAYADVFDFSTAQGASPEGSLIQLSNGKLYGMTGEGGANNKGVIFSYEPATDTYTKLFDFGGANGENPGGSFMQAGNGLLYAVTMAGGSINVGVVFSFNASNNTFNKLADFDVTDGAYAACKLVQASNGLLYGTAQFGGVNMKGTIFSFDISNNTITKIFDYTSASGSDAPAGLITVTTTGIAQLSAAGKTLSVYPNPAKDKITVSINVNGGSTAEINLINTLGQKIYSLPETPSPSHQTIDISKLKAGIYFLECIIDRTKTVTKFSKE